MFTASDALGEKVHRLLDQRRVLTTDDFTIGGTTYAYAMGETQAHVVRATQDGVYCDCIAFKNGHRCAHQLAAMVVWAEVLRLDVPFEVAV